MKKYLFDSLLIVFSVLFALGINSLADKRKIRKQKKIAVESLKKELQDNKKIFERWYTLHSAMGQRLDSLNLGMKEDLKNELAGYDFLRIDKIFDNPTMIDAIVQNTAWETCKSTNIINEFEFETIQRVTNVYSMQKIVMEETIMELVKGFFTRESLDTKNLNTTIFQMNILFKELLGQEKLMTYFYQDALAALDDPKAKQKSY